MNWKKWIRRAALIVPVVILLFFSGCGGASGAEGKTADCTISISCETLLENLSLLPEEKQDFVPEDGWILPETTVQIQEGDTVFDVLLSICTENKIHMEHSYTPLYGSEYIEGIGQLYEFDAGELSGWTYSVDGEFPEYGCDKYQLSGGEQIEWLFTCDMGRDLQTTDGGDAAEQISGDQSSLSLEEQILRTEDYLYQTVSEPEFGSTAGDWVMLALARGEYEMEDAYVQGYLASVEQTLKDTGGVLDEKKYTEYSRLILVLTALGQDVSDVAGYDLTAYLSDMDKICYQGINGPIWALIAMDSADYTFKEDASAASPASREGLTDYLLAKQLSDGGWSLGGSESDPDMTAMAVQALAGYANSSEEVAAALNKALDALGAMQQSDGGFSAWGEENLESCAQVLVALSAMGIDPETDERFVKNKNSVLDAVLAYGCGDGSFRHTSEGESDFMATEQACYAMIAYRRMLDGEPSLYDMTA